MLCSKDHCAIEALANPSRSQSISSPSLREYHEKIAARIEARRSASPNRVARSTVVALLVRPRDYPPTDEAGFLAFARNLRDPLLYDAIAGAEPAPPVWAYQNTTNHRRPYESLREMPGRLLAIGDSLCAFNPVNAQGMTLAALQAEALDPTLGNVTPTRQAQRALAAVADAAWLISTGEDLRYPTTLSAKPTRLARLTHRGTWTECSPPRRPHPPRVPRSSG